MREFDDFEKSVITELRNFQERGVKLNFPSILDFFFKDRAVKINRTSNEAHLLFDARTYARHDQGMNAWIPTEKAVNAVSPSIDTVIRLIFLLNYLEKNGLIFMYELGNNPDPISTFPILPSPPSPVELKISDQNVVSLLIKYFGQEIFTSQSLIELVKNNFRLKSDLQHDKTVELANQSLTTGKRSIKVGWFAIGLSTLISLISLGIAITFNQRSLELSKQPTKIESAELTRIQTNNEELLKELKQLNESIIDIDSLYLDQDSLARINVNTLNSINREIGAIKKMIKDANKR
ncbi:MAG: hypothetical protein JXR10_04085 [Cyclobacteriaceae bacterium]